MKWYFRVLVAAFLLLFPTALMCVVGSNSTTIHDGINKIYEISDTLTVLDNDARTDYEFPIPGGIAVVLCDVHLKGHGHASNASLSIAVDAKSHYGVNTDIAEDVVMIFNHQDEAATTNKVWIVQADTGDVEVIKPLILGTFSTRYVIADTIRLKIDANDDGGWEAENEDFLKLWVRIFPVSWSVMAGGESR